MNSDRNGSLMMNAGMNTDKMHGSRGTAVALSRATPPWRCSAVPSARARSRSSPSPRRPDADRCRHANGSDMMLIVLLSPQSD
jgi:hypothetical protein